ncbi:hypothetical protein [Neorickettsia sp. 179522]|uniref:hypothetical protein n=1 Tax=Neorickettsia sp. 179522 TaxID=1714371 RepID=UPI000B2EA8D6|nr:hypothetical protein [Neorickettsia sp. 179522]
MPGDTLLSVLSDDTYFENLIDGIFLSLAKDPNFASASKGVSKAELEDVLTSENFKELFEDKTKASTVKTILTDHNATAILTDSIASAVITNDTAGEVLKNANAAELLKNSNAAEILKDETAKEILKSSKFKEILKGAGKDTIKNILTDRTGTFEELVECSGKDKVKNVLTNQNFKKLFAGPASEEVEDILTNEFFGEAFTDKGIAKRVIDFIISIINTAN